MNNRKIVRSSAFVVWLYSTLIWAYVCARIIVSEVEFTPFIDGIDISFWQLGILTFIISAISLWIYLILKDDRLI
jgi:hypothetical protein